jgi:4-amino-4-deoxy-L-arabinose transferase-like glycosyltransferase
MKQDLRLLALICALGFLPLLGAAPLFDWDEINFAESAREMLVTGDFFRVQVNFQPFWEKPPLFFWLQALMMKLFGVNEFAARLPNALFGVLTVLTLYVHAFRQRGQGYARLVAGLYLASLLPVIYFKSGIIDPVFNFFIYLALMDWLAFDQGAGKGAAFRAGLWAGLATLAKGPVALLVTALVAGSYLLRARGLRLPWQAGLRFGLAWALPVLGWYGLETLVHGPGFIEKFLRYQAELFTQGVAGHEQPWYYHLLVFVPGCFPMSALAFGAMLAQPEAREYRRLRRFMLLWFWLVLGLFSLATTKIVHYASLLYFPAAYLAASYLEKIGQGQQKMAGWVWALLLPGLLVWGLGASLVNAAYALRESLIPWLRDPLAVASLRVEAGWTGWEWLCGLLFLLGSALALWQLRQRKVFQFIAYQAVATLLFVNLAYGLILPKVARHTQGAPLDFFCQAQGRPAYVMTMGYKSYLPYFYAQITPGDSLAADPAWLLSGPADREVWLAVKAHRADAAFRAQVAAFDSLGCSGGFCFYRRPPGR